eukprot:TRINITY_DN10066_c0_g4_i3.p1 TRINITY_DN10066_c0_g4~~TRINITY_DN10066_c0_g4_i3.p1  ORF type:complete len:292 (+),score=22.61 TRINITY_DN10066_c0_g4_i3:695-1570(+)
MILKLITLFSVSTLSNLRPLYISYDDALQSTHPLDTFKEVWGFPNGLDENSSDDKYLKGWIAQDVFPVFLFDEFQTIYQTNINHLLLSQVVDLMAYGMPHILSITSLLGLVLITGSSSFLPELLYKPPVDLNSSKLTKQRLSCINNLEPFKEFVHLLGYFSADQLTDDFLFTLYWKSSGAHRSIDTICRQLHNINNPKFLHLHDESWPLDTNLNLRTTLESEEYMPVLSLFLAINSKAGMDPLLFKNPFELKAVSVIMWKDCGLVDHHILEDKRLVTEIGGLIYLMFPHHL